jgi:hypothetical protein
MQRRSTAMTSDLPKFVEQEFRDFLTCGVLEHGFARLRCGDCAFERRVPFSCKGRGFCPIARMASDRPAHGDDATVDVDVPPFQRDRLTDPHTRARERQNQRVEDDPVIDGNVRTA